MNLPPVLSDLLTAELHPLLKGSHEMIAIVRNYIEAFPKFQKVPVTQFQEIFNRPIAGLKRLCSVLLITIE